jgi:glycosyltransferase involved in cell wall biosynthesis
MDVSVAGGTISPKAQQICVMQLVADLEVAGAQEVVRSLAENLPALGCCLVVGTFRDGPLRARIEAAGIRVEVLPGRRHSVIAFPLFVGDMLRIWRALATLIRYYQVDVVQTHLLRSLDFLVLLLRYGTPLGGVFWTFHNVRFELTASDLSQHQWLLGYKKLTHRLLYRLGARWVSGFIAVSDEIAGAMGDTLGPLGGKVSIIHNGVDASRYCGTADAALVKSQLRLGANARLIVTVGRLVEQKGHRYLIDASVPVFSLWPEIQLLIIGDGELREVLERQAEQLGLAEHCHFLGIREDVPHLLSAADLFVLPSLWEGLSLALLEAMAAARPIVATDVSGTAQAMIPGQTGLLVPPGDSQALAGAMVQLLSDPAQAQAMGQAARQRAERAFSAQKQATEHLALYRRALHSEGRP